ncbi:hypothetical protein L1987_57703 [Smallanthus sonchifolius]|uniref:Uncharacterized protein n=1 Tax=Smallanthus sonchifolius TaxID=185202 RepID=A0ACB9DDI7_9ASTR|nr:hypothetical protein L1987_57703 [Smallanthus sonchifolius]
MIADVSQVEVNGELYVVHVKEFDGWSSSFTKVVLDDEEEGFEHELGNNESMVGSLSDDQDDEDGTRYHIFSLNNIILEPPLPGKEDYVGPIKNQDSDMVEEQANQQSKDHN